MLRIGITGGIGSGKSVVCRYFSALQIPYYNADEEAKYIIDHDPGIQKKLKAYFGEASYTKNGLNKSFIRKRVFGNSAALAKLNEITHPVVLNHFDRWCKEKRKAKHPFIIKEAALVFESDSYKSLDFIITVIAPIATRITRVMKRDGKSKDEVEVIIKKQMSDEEKIKRSNYVINNPDD